MTARKRAELQQRREALARNEQLARTGPPRARFAYAAAATKQRARIARLEAELANAEHWESIDSAIERWKEKQS